MNLVAFMSKIRAMLLKSSVFLYALMNILILHFCDLINGIFAIIEAKLLFYLYLVQNQIIIDYMNLYLDIAEFTQKLSELQSLVDKYKLILETVKGLLSTLKTLASHIRILSALLTIIGSFINIINKIICKLKSIFLSSDKLIGILCCLNHQKQQSTESSNGCSSKENIIETIRKISRSNITVTIGNIDLSLIINFYDIYNNIKKLLDMDDKLATFAIMSIIRKLYILETINIGKLLVLIGRIQLKYEVILVRGYFLKCTILFYQEIKPTITSLVGSLKFECCNPKEFLSSCFKIENYIGTMSKSINECIKNLATACNKCKGCAVRKELLQLYFNMIRSIMFLKFYVDLIAREILIFKMIILTLIEMSVSSAIVDAMISIIGEIKDIDKAIPTLVGVHVYLRTFYYIQLQNTMTIFALSNALRFSESIHGYYDVLVMNLYWINRLIWAIECFINHLIVFSYVTKGLNSLKSDIGNLGDIIVQISNVGTSISTITNRLDLIKHSITQLKKVSDSVDITNWKESAQRIRNQTQPINTNVTQINSQIDLIKDYVDSLLKSFATLVSLYYFLLVLIQQVHKEIQKIKPKILRTGVLSRYLNVDILSVMEPCNKQLMFILAYLIVMSVVMRNLIIFVHNTIILIYGKVAWLKVLTSKLKEHLDNIYRGVVDMECAIEGVPRNQIRCSLQSLTNNTRVTDINKINELYSLYSIS